MSENELNQCCGRCNQESQDEQAYWACVEACEKEHDARVMARCSIVPTEVLERIGLALWSMMEEESWTDELLGLEPGDRLQIPGALTDGIEGVTVNKQYAVALGVEDEVTS